MLPVWAIRVEDTMSQQLDGGLSAQLSNIEVRELRGQYTLNILRFVGEDQCFSQNPRRECISDSLEPFIEVLELIFPPAG